MILYETEVIIWDLYSCLQSIRKVKVDYILNIDKLNDQIFYNLGLAEIYAEGHKVPSLSIESCLPYSPMLLSFAYIASGYNSSWWWVYWII